MHPTRRDTIRAGLLGGATVLLPAAVHAAPAPAFAPAPIRWIDGAAPAMHAGQTFGVAWPRGVVKRGTRLAVQTAAGEGVPAQSWTTATWPDGSLKWTAHAIPADVAPAGLIVTRGRETAPRQPVRVTESADAVTIRSGELSWVIARSGDALVRSASYGGRPVLGPVTLIGAVRSDPLHGEPTPFAGTIERVTVEQRGPVRAVVKIEGRHVAGDRRWMPFTARLYAYAGSAALRIVHSVVVDGDPAKDFLSALGLRAAVPMTGALHDRHLRIATDGQTFAEGVRPLTGLRRDPGKPFREAQIAGQATPPLAQMAPAVRDVLERIPAWGDVRLEQPNANGFTIQKRTGPGHGWIDSAEGHRAPGLAYVGGPTGGVALAQRYFWQRHPTALHIDGAAGDTAQLTAWLWSPEAPAMDLRPYHGVMGMEGYDAQNQGLSVTYEDYEPGWDDAGGIARTSELMLWALPATPPTETLAAMARMQAQPPQLMAAPAHLHAAQVFGDWNLPDRSTPNRTAIENQLTDLVDFYAGEVDRRSWYGFWNHGDVMHSYDADRHQWRYDIGGFAWANSELSPDLWLWTQALRTGDAQTFRLAEAMTRHTGEVDVYHTGRFRGLGTRHGVQHWSDSSKQPRVSNANYRRIFYYLTADERVGDLLRDLVTSDQALTRVEIGRKVPGAKRPVLPAGTIEMTFGTTWCPLAAAWLTEWERTGDTRWRDRIVAGLDGIGRLPHGWMTGSAPFDMASGRFIDQNRKIGLSHLNAVFGAVEISAELIRLLDVPRYRAAWLEYCRWYNAPQADYLAKFGAPFGPRNLREGHSRLTAYAAFQEKDATLAARAAEEFLSGDAGLGTWPADPRHVVGSVLEWPGVSTNAASQWGLAAIQTLALVPEALDRVAIVAPDAPGRKRAKDNGRD
ncbi:Tat pathway signal sequence domain protein [Sphingomonas sp. RP10(2022)]|uniref:Tat pathway signal sequence domain protein n=1 Tax=Sphingomonas liriopis TaxID=2949094 RepID=A0A9X2HWC2_9SPHN|nr:Tat pathway signal sequence domain protein [Sphingomonas liriopis]MCP3734749.1 Tat pathway signal sequence domain protein [Sphingomonas liriopis]